MILDKELACSVGQTVTAAATTVSTNTIDLLNALNDQGIGEPARAFANVTAAFVGGASVQVNLIESPNANLSAPTVIATGPVVLTANAVLGARLLDVRLPNTTKRYLGFQVVSVGVHTAGAFDAHVLSDVSHPRYLPMNTGR